MTKILDVVTKPVITQVAIKCDRCGVTHEGDSFEAQEFLSWKDRCGYGNFAFGDMSTVEIDLCQYCTKDVLGEWIRVSTYAELCRALEGAEYDSSPGEDDEEPDPGKA